MRLWGCTSNAGHAVGRHQGFHMGVVGAVGLFLGDVQGEKNLIQLCLQFESAGLASKGEQEPAPHCLCAAQSWNGTAEMQSWNTLKPGILCCWDWSLFQKEKDLKIIILYTISWSQLSWNKSFPRASFLQQLWMKKPHLSNALAEPLCCCSWVLGTNSPFSPRQGCAEIHKSTLCFFFFPAPNSSVL